MCEHLAAETYPNSDLLFPLLVQGDTFSSLEAMTERLVDEVVSHAVPKMPERISFVGHSLGCVLIRSAIVHPR